MKPSFTKSFCLYILLTNSIISGSNNPTPEQQKANLLSSFFNMIQTNEQKLSQTLNHPEQFSNFYGFNYTAEELCNLQDQRGMMSLHIASMHANVRRITAEKLILTGANLNTQTHRGLTPLHFPQNLTISRTLILHGARLDIKDYIYPQQTPIEICELLQENDWTFSTAYKKRREMFEQGFEYQKTHTEQINARQKKIADKISCLKKDNAAIQKTLERAQSKNPKFSERDLYNRYVQQIFKTTDSVAIAAINRRANILKHRIES